MTVSGKHGASTTERLLLGDWNRWIRDPIDVLRLVYIGGGIAVVIAGSFGRIPSLAFGAAVALTARAISLPRPFDLAIVAGMLLPTAGNTLGLFDRYDAYDSVTHLILSGCAAPVFYIGLARLGVVPDMAEARRSHHRVGIAVTTTALGVAFGTLYEIYEYVADTVFNAGLSTGYADTIADLALDFAGSAAGGALLVVWSLFGWATTRRLPAEIAAARLDRASSAT
jgi:hypothetical protein